MAYLVVENFKAGVDRRSEIYALPPGALYTGKNAHLNRGGEIEKRKAFVLRHTLPAGSTFGLHALGGELWTFGSVATPAGIPYGVNYQRCQHPAAAAMTGILCTENFNNKIHVVATYDDGSIYHFYDGARITSHETQAAAASSNIAIAKRLAALIDADSNYIASASSTQVTITAAVPGHAFSIVAAAVDGGSTNDQTLVATIVQPNVVAVAALQASCEFTIAGGSVGTANAVNAITIGGVSVLNNPVQFSSTSAALAAAVAAQINSSSTGYSASAAGVVVTVKAAAFGTAANGRAVVVTPGGNVSITGGTVMAGGVDAVAAVPEIATVVVGGTFEAADHFSVTLTPTSPAGPAVTFATTGLAPGMGTFVKTFNTKVYAVAQSLVEFCAINDDTAWSTGTGQGNINFSNQSGSPEALNAIGIYQKQLAFFSRQNCQIWAIDPDPALNSPQQFIPGIGCLAPRSATSFGDADLFFLADTGIRSLRIRNASNAASVSDVGTAIDPLIQDTLASLSEHIGQAAVGIIEPREGRYMVAIGPFIFVFSYFPGSHISAWSTYEPGFSVTDWASIGQQVYCRAGDSVYVYGGLDGQTYGADYQVEAVLPYLDGQKPATPKELQGIDIAAVGVWTVEMGLDANQPDTRDTLATIHGTSFGKLRIPAAGTGTHFGMRLTHQGAGPAKLSKVIVHYDSDDAD